MKASAPAATPPAGTFYTPAEVAAVLKISPKSVISRFCGMAGVFVMPDVSSRGEKRRYRSIRIPKHVLDRFTSLNTVQTDTP